MSKLIHKGYKFDLQLVDVETDHGTVQRELIVHPGAVVVLPFLDIETIILIQNERYAVKKTLWELPAGTLEPGEKIESCAYREVEEETGYKANKMTPLISFYTSPGFCDEKLYAFVAKDLHYVGQRLDETEKIKAVPVKLETALKMIQEGKIEDAKSISTLCYYALSSPSCRL